MGPLGEAWMSQLGMCQVTAEQAGKGQDMTLTGFPRGGKERAGCTSSEEVGGLWHSGHGGRTCGKWGESGSGRPEFQAGNSVQLG